MSSSSETDSHLGQHDMPDDQQDWEEWDDDDERTGVKCLLSDAVFPSVNAAIAHDREQGFDLREYMTKEHLGQYDMIKVINYFRNAVQAGSNPAVALLAGSRPWDKDEYFQPVLADDELLFHDWEEEEEVQEGTVGRQASNSTEGGERPGDALAQLQRENEALRVALQSMQSVLLQAEGGGGLAELLRQQQLEDGGAPLAAAPRVRQGGDADAGPSGSVPKAAAASAEQAERIDQSYFESYSFFDIHRDMLGDKARTEAYQAALECNPGLMKGATVLDLGCGTAILSMFAARAGAAAVIGVDGSEEIAKYARANCAANGVSSEEGGAVTVVSGRVEALTQLPLEQGSAGKVDVLVSEWMGYALLFESMLDSVLHARDRFLRPGGAVLPDLAHIYVAGGGEGSTGLAFWTDVYGFTMRPIQDSIRQSGLERAVVRTVGAGDLVSEAVCVKCLDLATMAAADQDFTSDFRLDAKPGAASQLCHSLVVWFDTVFSERFCRDHPVTLTTSPHATQTHWAQTVLLLREPIQLSSPGLAAVGQGSRGGAAAIEGCISFARNKKRHRSLDIAVQYSAVYNDGSKSPPQAVIYAMGVSDS